MQKLGGNSGRIRHCTPGAQALWVSGKKPSLILLSRRRRRGSLQAALCPSHHLQRPSVPRGSSVGSPDLPPTYLRDALRGERQGQSSRFACPDLLCSWKGWDVDFLNWKRSQKRKGTVPFKMVTWSLWAARRCSGENRAPRVLLTGKRTALSGSV